MCAICSRTFYQGADKYRIVVKQTDSTSTVFDTPRICRLCAARIMDYLTEQVRGGEALNAAR